MQHDSLNNNTSRLSNTSRPPSPPSQAQPPRPAQQPSPAAQPGSPVRQQHVQPTLASMSECQLASCPCSTRRAAASTRLTVVDPSLGTCTAAASRRSRSSKSCFCGGAGVEGRGCVWEGQRSGTKLSGGRKNVSKDRKAHQASVAQVDSGRSRHLNSLPVNRPATQAR